MKTIFFLMALCLSFATLSRADTPDIRQADDSDSRTSLKVLGCNDADFQTLGFPKRLSALTLEVRSGDSPVKVSVAPTAIKPKVIDGTDVLAQAVILVSRSEKTKTELVGLGFAGSGTIGDAKWTVGPNSSPEGMLGVYLLSGGFNVGQRGQLSLDQASLVVMMQGEEGQKEELDKRGSTELNGLPLVNNAVGEKRLKQRAERDSVMQHGVGVAAAIMLKKDAPKDDMGERLLDASVELPANGNARLIILIGSRCGSLRSITINGDTLPVQDERSKRHSNSKR